MFFATLEAALGPRRVPPVRAFHIAPPSEMIIERHRPIRRSEHDRAGDEILRWRAGKIFRLRRSLGDGHIAGRIREFLKLLIRDLRAIHPKAVDEHAMNRPRITHRIGTARGSVAWIVATHRKLTAGNPDHAGRRGVAGRFGVGHGGDEARNRPG